MTNGKLKNINLRKQRQLSNLIAEHNSLAIEIDKFNLMLRKFAGSMFINCSFTQIISMYSIIQTDNIAFVWAIHIFLMYFIFGFGLSFLFTQQIKSAHRSYKLIHLIVC